MRTPVLIATLALGCAAPSPAAEARKPTPEAPQARPWNGGKPRPPFTLRATPRGPVRADTPLPLVATLTPERDCSSLSTRVRGLNGVVVRGTEKQHPTCAPGLPVTHEVMVTVPSGVSGYAVVDVRMRVEGQSYESSRSIPLRAGGKAPEQLKPQGEVARDEDGGKVIILRPSPPPPR